MRLPVKLQCKLNLARVVRVIARCRYAREVLRIREVQRSRLGEIRMVGQVEKLRPELNARTFRNGEFFEQRPIQAMKSRSDGLRRSASERTQVRLTDCSRCRRIVEGRGVE